jgi:hypothetical protein
MKKIWNKETYGATGLFKYGEDWGEEIPDAGFTDVQPIGLEYGVPPHQHWDEGAGAWVLDDDTEDRGALRNMTAVPQVALVTALNVMGELGKLDALMTDPVFRLAWGGAGGYVHLDDPITLDALTQVNIDLDAVKRKIMEIAANPDAAIVEDDSSSSDSADSV